MAFRSKCILRQPDRTAFPGTGGPVLIRTRFPAYSWGLAARLPHDHPRDAHGWSLGSRFEPSKRAKERQPVRVTRVLKRLMDLPGVTVPDVASSRSASTRSPGEKATISSRSSRWYRITEPARSSGAGKARMLTRLTPSSTNSARNAPRRSRRSRWT